VYSQLFDGQGEDTIQALLSNTTNCIENHDAGVFRHQNLIPDGRFDFESKTPHLSGDDKTLFINFAKRMLAWMPEERATAKELLNDPWLQHTED
jgi:serine/threonine protein kinase